MSFRLGNSPRRIEWDTSLPSGSTILPTKTLAQWQCPRCGYAQASNDDSLAPTGLYHPWHVRSRKEVKAYVETLPLEAREWLLALFVDDGLNLLAVDTVARGDISSCPVPFARILCRGHALKATGFILVHNHPSGDPQPSDTDIQLTRRLRRASEDLDMPLLDHFVIAGDDMVNVGRF